VKQAHVSSRHHWPIFAVQIQSLFGIADEVIASIE